MKKVKALILLLLIFLLLNCSGSGDYTGASQYETMADTLPAPPAGTAAGPSRKFIRTADLRFRVKNLLATTHMIEKITESHGGFITLSALTNPVEKTETRRISRDSVLEINHYTSTGTMTLRVPDAHLDTVLREISLNAGFIDTRTVKAEEVSLSLRSERLTRERLKKSLQRLEKLPQKEELRNQNEAIADQAGISALFLTDQINFSTINLQMYQRGSLNREILPDPESAHVDERNFGARLAESFKNGWTYLAEFILLMTRLWALGLAGLIMYLIFRTWEMRRNVIRNRPA